MSDVKQILLELKGTSDVLKSIEQVLEKYDVKIQYTCFASHPPDLRSLTLVLSALYFSGFVESSCPD